MDDEYLKTEYDIYRAMNSNRSLLRLAANCLLDFGFRMLHEIRQQLRCHEVSGILKCEFIVVAAEPCPRVRGLMTQFCQRGTLARLLRFMALIKLSFKPHCA
jgi:hypothetical protein